MKTWVIREVAFMLWEYEESYVPWFHKNLEYQKYNLQINFREFLDISIGLS